MKKLLLIFALNILCVMVFHAQDFDPIKSLDTRVSQLESDKKWLLAGVAFLTIIWGLIVFWTKKLTDRTIKNAEEDFRKKTEEKLAAIEKEIVKAINDKREIIDRAMEASDKEGRLLASKRVYLWGESDYEIIKKVLKNARFNVSEHFFTTEEEAKEGYDILIVNNQKGTLDMKEVLKKVNALPDKTCALYYNTTRVNFPSDDLIEAKQDKVNFANGAAQIYGNLLNLMKYQG